jgi:hypothetical protein
VLGFPATSRASPLRGSVLVLGLIPSLAVLRRFGHDRLVTRNGRCARRVALAGGRDEEADGLHGPERNAVSFAPGSHLSPPVQGLAVRLTRVARAIPQPGLTHAGSAQQTCPSRRVKSLHFRAARPLVQMPMYPDPSISVVFVMVGWRQPGGAGNQGAGPTGQQPRLAKYGTVDAQVEPIIRINSSDRGACRVFPTLPPFATRAPRVIGLLSVLLLAGCGASSTSAPSTSSPSTAAGTSTPSGSAATPTPAAAAGSTTCPTSAEIATLTGTTFPAPQQSSSTGSLVCSYNDTTSGANLVIEVTAAPGTTASALQIAANAAASAYKVTASSVSGFGRRGLRVHRRRRQHQFQRRGYERHPDPRRLGPDRYHRGAHPCKSRGGGHARPRSVARTSSPRRAKQGRARRLAGPAQREGLRERERLPCGPKRHGSGRPRGQPL